MRKRIGRANEVRTGIWKKKRLRIGFRLGENHKHRREGRRT